MLSICSRRCCAGKPPTSPRREQKRRRPARVSRPRSRFPGAWHARCARASHRSSRWRWRSRPPGLIVDHRVGLQVIGKGCCRHIADFGAHRLGMPAARLSSAGSPASGSIIIWGTISAATWSCSEAKQPVSRAAMAGGDLGNGLGSRQPDIGLEQQLRQRRTAQAGATGKAGARQAGGLDHLRQPPAESVDRISLAHVLSTIVTKILNCTAINSLTQ